VQFEIDANGILHVLARDIKTGRQRVVEMKSAVDVDDAAVQRMVEESVEHAFEDLAARRWIEAKLKANELLSATRKGLADCGANWTRITPQRLKRLCAKWKPCWQGESPETKSGDAKRLQAACAALDETTKPLADLLMDKLTDALLRKRGVAVTAKSFLTTKNAKSTKGKIFVLFVFFVVNRPVCGHECGVSTGSEMRTMPDCPVFGGRISSLP
jgi:molecular chaperone DnaK